MAEPRPGDAPAPAGGPPAPLRWLYAFGRFWQDFLIGDTPELFIGAVAVVGLVALACVKPGLRTVAAVAAPILVAGVLTASVYRAVRRGAS
jgi:hypothetical protein